MFDLHDYTSVVFAIIFQRALNDICVGTRRAILSTTQIGSAVSGSYTATTDGVAIAGCSSDITAYPVDSKRADSAQYSSPMRPIGLSSPHLTQASVDMQCQ